VSSVAFRGNRRCRTSRLSSALGDGCIVWIRYAAAWPGQQRIGMACVVNPPGKTAQVSQSGIGSINEHGADHDEMSRTVYQSFLRVNGEERERTPKTALAERLVVSRPSAGRPPCRIGMAPAGAWMSQMQRQQPHSSWVSEVFRNSFGKGRRLGAYRETDQPRQK
jgi:hypothetical protein